MAGLLDYYRQLWKEREQNPDQFQFKGVAPLGTFDEFELKYGGGNYQPTPANPMDNPELTDPNRFNILGKAPKAPLVGGSGYQQWDEGAEESVKKESGDPSWYKRSQTMLWASLLGDEKMPRTVRSGRKLALLDPKTPGLDVPEFAPANLSYDKGIQGLSKQEKSWRGGDDEDDLYSLLRGLG